MGWGREEVRSGSLQLRIVTIQVQLPGKVIWKRRERERERERERDDDDGSLSFNRPLYKHAVAYLQST